MNKTLPAAENFPYKLENSFELDLSSRRAFTQQLSPLEDDEHLLGACKRAELFKKNPEPKKNDENLFTKTNTLNLWNEKDLMEIELEKKTENFFERKKEETTYKALKSKKIWRKKVFYILMLVIRFIHIMKTKIIALRIWETKIQQLDIIGDPIFFHEKNGGLPKYFEGSENYKRNMILIARERV